MLQVILGVILFISDFQKPCASKTAVVRVKDTSRSLCYPVLCGHCFHLVMQSTKPQGFLLNPFKLFLNILLSDSDKSTYCLGFLKF